jgi:hypothetical protein
MKRNRRHVENVLGPRLSIAADVPPVLISMLMEAETSGGLLFSIAADRADGVLDAFRRAGEEAWEIGVVLAAPEVRIRP